MRTRLWTLLFFGLLSGFASPAEPDEKTTKLLAVFRNEFVDVEPGTEKFPKSFQRGSTRRPSEQPVKEVTLRHPFAIAKYEMTQELYASVMGANPSRWKGPRNSAEQMTWSEARECCRRLTTLMRDQKLISAEEEIRLPTEAEWEYCCRAGTETAYSFGDEARAPQDNGTLATLLDPYAWHTGNAAGNDPEVGVLKPNPWGLYDFHGYLWEYCEDEWTPTYEDAPVDGTAHKSPTKEAKRHVIRGGSWKNPWTDLTSTARMEAPSELRDDAVGFRCIKAKVTP